jgi:hypothetical protein
MMESIMISKRFGKNLAAMFLYYFPVLYLGIILSVTLHEILGHGLVALAMGGKFKGFGLYPDGMGWADIDVSGLSEPRIAFVLFAGGSCTAIASLIGIALGMAMRKRFHAHAGLLLCAFVCLMDGMPYFFWDAIYLSGVGDISGIYRMYPIPLLRIGVISISGLLMAAGIIAFNVLVFGISNRRMSEGGNVNLRGRISISALLLLLQAAGWFSFNWNELVPGVGLLPGISAMALTAAVLAILLSRGVQAEPRAVQEGIPRPHPYPLKPTIAAWAAAVCVALLTAFWSGEGVFF